MVYLNAELKGLTPITLTSIPADEYSLKIVKDGYEDFGEIISVLPDKKVDKIVTLVKADANPPKISSIPITTSTSDRDIPIEAKITDDIKVKEAHLFYRKEGDGDFISLLMEGKGDAFRASIPKGFVSTKGIEYYITATDGINTSYFPLDPSTPLKIRVIPHIKGSEVQHVPKRLLGGIYIASEPSQAKVYLEGKYKGKTPLKIERLEPWRPYELLLTHEGFSDWKTKTFVEPLDTTKIKAVLKTQLPKEAKEEEKGVGIVEKKVIEEEPIKKDVGLVYITSLPPRAKVYVKGMLIGETPLRGVKMEVGKRSIKVVKGGYASSTKEVIVEKDKNTYVNFTLEKGY